MGLGPGEVRVGGRRVGWVDGLDGGVDEGLVEGLVGGVDEGVGDGVTVVGVGDGVTVVGVGVGVGETETFWPWVICWVEGSDCAGLPDR